ncbi:SDR family oxidoreductase [Pseudovibrio sp. Tun.PSC04-5.I4]|uniref:SDR family NAD(P)-dependent oxidoreductase n=1 Tax=Pseudovibrio sp. Tun.PSC04-5.I4 TaxID=1798213 RepID=UPI00087F0B4B|nr:SDR family oxidoreductase [Pseudovibrio sp. Tun.PSC04-5.I4]SDR48746.1 3-oxoacyl-[acyl-carrier protein] reductase [Pseudovibrio sp. Tun.PSC04-5.I4]
MAKIMITGASTGIGAETARAFAQGNELFLVYNRSTDKAKTLEAELVQKGAIVHLLQSDITSEIACIELFRKISRLTDTLDALINNAGGLVRRQAADQLEWQLMDEIFRLNAFSLFKITSLAIPMLRNGRNASIVNISSIVVRHGGPTATLYGAAKGAVDTFTRGLSKELAPDIRVNSVAPGVIDTPFHEKVSTPDQMDAWAANTPLKRNGQPANIVSAIKLLVENDFITGESIDVNGGMMIR